MNVLLIRPEYDDDQCQPHLGLGYLSASLKKNGHNVKILDGLREKIEYDPKDWDLAGFTALSIYFGDMCKEVERAKLRGLKTIIGGAHVICDPTQSLKDSGADYAATGEGERTIVQLANGRDPSQVEGLFYWSDDKIKKSNPDLTKLFEKKVMYTTTIGNESRDFINDVDDFGEPDWEGNDPRTFPQSMPHGTVYKEAPFAPIITTRGCPYSCTYCSAPITAGRKMRYRDPVKVVDEIERLVKEFGVKEIQIEDDNFTMKRAHAAAVCEELIKRKVNVHWSLPNGVRIDKLDPELLALMKKSGCYSMSLGIESANQRVLDIIKKRLDQKLVRKVVTWVKESGIDGVGFFMIGFPTETRKEIMETINFAQTLDLERAYFGKAAPYPGTELYDLWISKYAKDTEIDWKHISGERFNGEWCEVPPKELDRLQTIAFFKFYFTKWRIFKILWALNVNQIGRFAKRILAVSIKSKWYNRIFASKTHTMYINPAERKEAKKNSLVN